MAFFFDNSCHGCQSSQILVVPAALYIYNDEMGVKCSQQQKPKPTKKFRIRCWIFLKTNLFFVYLLYVTMVGNIISSEKESNLTAKQTTNVLYL